MREGWQSVHLGDVATSRSRTVSARSMDLPYIGLEHFDSGSPRIVRSARSGEFSGSGLLVEPGDVLFSKLRPYLNKVAVAHEHAICSTEVLVWRSNEPTVVAQDYLAVLLRAPEAVEYANINSAGSRMPRTSSRIMSAFEITLPPLAEQRRVVDLIAAIDHAIDAADGETAATLDVFEHARAALVQRIEDRTRFVDVMTRVRLPVKIEPTAEYPEVGVRSHGRGTFLKNPITGALLGAKKVFWLTPGDLTFNLVFAWEGAVALLGDDVAGKVASHRFPTYRGSSEWVAEYAAHYFRTPEGAHALLDYSPGGAGRNKTLSLKRLENHVMPFPSDEVGRSIVATLKRLSDSAEAARAHADTLRTLRSNLLAVLASGEHEIPESYDQLLDDTSKGAAV